MEISMDFTLKTYTLLMETLLKSGYSFCSVEKYQPHLSNNKTVILRHDVDKLPVNSLKTAIIENKLGIKGTYYFRIVKQSFNRDIIKNIAAMGHEIGYHYEDLALAKGDFSKAIRSFENNLKRFSDLYDVKTIAMHGSPVSAHDNRHLWNNFRYQDFGITREPYFDIDFSEVLYLTDTGRRWDGKSVSVRDKELATERSPMSNSFHFRTTGNIIEAAKKGTLAARIMLNFHPQRWTDNIWGWSKELIVQSIKNPVKKIIVRRNISFVY